MIDHGYRDRRVSPFYLACQPFFFLLLSTTLLFLGFLTVDLNVVRNQAWIEKNAARGKAEMTSRGLDNFGISGTRIGSSIVVLR